MYYPNNRRPPDHRRSVVPRHVSRHWVQFAVGFAVLGRDAIVIRRLARCPSRSFSIPALSRSSGETCCAPAAAAVVLVSSTPAAVDVPGALFVTVALDGDGWRRNRWAGAQHRIARALLTTARPHAHVIA